MPTTSSHEAVDPVKVLVDGSSSSFWKGEHLREAVSTFTAVPEDEDLAWTVDEPWMPEE